MMCRSEVLKHFDSLLLKTYDDYCRKNRYEIENITKNKITKDNFIIPQLNEYQMLFTNNYKLSELKEIAKHYKLKITGNKTILISRIFSYLYLTKFSLKIQKMIRNHLTKKCKKQHGPAYLKRNLCVNAIDFLTMDDIKDIIPTQFFSYKDKNGFIYGFDVVSFYNLIKKSENNTILNPFTKSQIPNKIIRKFQKMIYLSNLLNIPVNLKIGEQENILVIKSPLDESKILFEHINELGNYANFEWFMNLSKYELLILVQELLKIWNYRAELNVAKKKLICNPGGNPFYNENIMNNQTIIDYLERIPNIDNVRLEILDILNKFVKKGVNDEYKKIGTYYVLGALTLVSSDAENSLPWLYESFSYT